MNNPVHLLLRSADKLAQAVQVLDDIKKDLANLAQSMEFTKETSGPIPKWKVGNWVDEIRKCGEKL